MKLAQTIVSTIAIMIVVYTTVIIAALSAA